MLLSDQVSVGVQMLASRVILPYMASSVRSCCTCCLELVCDCNGAGTADGIESAFGIGGPHVSGQMRFTLEPILPLRITAPG